MRFRVGYNNDEDAAGGIVLVVWDKLDFVNVSESKSNRYSVDYQITSVAPVGELSFAVAGKTRDGRTIVEKWFMEDPATQIAQEPGERPRVKVVTGGNVELVRRVYDERSITHDIIRLMWSDRHRDDCVHVQFWTHPDIYRLEFDTERLTSHPANRLPLPKPVPSAPYRVLDCYVLYDTFELPPFTSPSVPNGMYMLRDRAEPFDWPIWVYRDSDGDSLIESLDYADTATDYFGGLPHGFNLQHVCGS